VESSIERVLGVDDEEDELVTAVILEDDELVELIDSEVVDVEL